MQVFHVEYGASKRNGGKQTDTVVLTRYFCCCATIDTVALFWALLISCIERGNIS